MNKTRLATKADLKQILAILNYEIENTTAVYHEQPWDLPKIEQWYKDKLKSNYPVLVVEINQEIAGYGTLGTFRNFSAYKLSVEHSIYVKPSFQGQGIGKILMEDLIQTAKGLKLHTMIAGIDASNQSSIDFHKKFNFTEVGRLNQVGYKFDTWLDLVFMQLFLK